MKIAANSTAPNAKLQSKTALKNVKCVNSDFDLARHFAGRMDIIRFLAIASIVWGHCLFSVEQKTFTTLNDQITQSVMLQLGRLGTIMFFIISGYFISSKIKTFNVISYLKYRAFSLILPWFVFLVILMIVQLAQMGVFAAIFNQPLKLTLTLLYNLMVGNIFHSVYWFVPVAITSSIILIIFKKHTNKLWFGMLLAIITLFYGVNLYYEWIPANHTKAFLGYTFFMWLGVQFKSHIHLVKRFSDNISGTWLIIAITMLFIAACFEGTYLREIHSIDPYASIRISNALLSVTLFIALLKSNKLKALICLKPRAYTFGIYLVHCIIIIAAMPLVNYYMTHMHPFSHMAQFIMVEIIFFLAIFTLSYLAAYLFKHLKPVKGTIAFNHENVDYTLTNQLQVA